MCRHVFLHCEGLGMHEIYLIFFNMNLKPIYENFIILKYCKQELHFNYPLVTMYFYMLYVVKTLLWDFWNITLSYVVCVCCRKAIHVGFFLPTCSMNWYIRKNSNFIPSTPWFVRERHNFTEGGGGVKMFIYTVLDIVGTVTSLENKRNSQNPLILIKNGDLPARGISQSCQFGCDRLQLEDSKLFFLFSSESQIFLMLCFTSFITINLMREWASPVLFKIKIDH